MTKLTKAEKDNYTNLVCSIFGHNYIETGTQHILVCSRCGKELHLKQIADIIIHNYPDGKVKVDKAGDQ